MGFGEGEGRRFIDDGAGGADWLSKRMFGEGSCSVSVDGVFAVKLPFVSRCHYHQLLSPQQ